MKKVLLGYRFKPEGFECLEKNFELIYPTESLYLSKEQILNILPEVEVLVPKLEIPTDKEIIDAGKKLELIANFGVGYNNIDVDYAVSKGITVTNTPVSVLEPTAEFCFALLLATARKIGWYNNQLHKGENCGQELFGDVGVPVYGQTLGIYGMGRIGRAVARRGIASGMKILYHNRHRLESEIEKKYEAEYVTFDELLQHSDFISLNAPATPETYHIIGEREFSLMKPTAILINTSRGSLVDEKALIEALEKKKIFGAGLDVYESQPHTAPALMAAENVVLAPHAGTQTYQARIDMEKEVAQNIINFYEGGKIERVN